MKTIFSNTEKEIPFDVFSASFYIISRYEEYLPHQTDLHGRYLPEQSILFQLESLESPLVDKWCLELAKHLKISVSRSYKFISTIDVDNAYAYKFKPLHIKIGGTLKALVNRNTEDLKRRVATYFGGKSDPYDTYSLIENVHKQHKVEGIYFFLLSNRSTQDKNLSFTNKHLRALVSALQSENLTGIHPGYNSYLDKKITLEEKLRLESIIDEEVKHSRQHFLKFKFPDTPEILDSIGIKHDYSLAYASVLGFRAGTCTPFKFYNLREEKTTNLTLHSSPIMDATLNNYLKVTPETAVKLAHNIIKEVKEVKGELVTIWHNETLSDIREWKAWRPVFEEIIRLAKK